MANELRLFSARRILMPVCVTIFALVAIPFTLSSVQSGRAALRWWPFSASARAEAAQNLLATKLGDPATRAQIKTLAIDAIRISPINAVAVQSLGLAAAASGEETTANRAMDYSLRLSRHQLATHLWFIERNVQRNDIDGALRHYDRAMQTSVASRTTLIPVLVSAAQTPAVAARLIPLLRHKRNWWGEYVHMLIGTAADPETPYTIVRALGLRSDDPDHPDFLGRTIERLVAAGKVDQAIDLYTHNGGAGGGHLLRNGDFEHPDKLPPLDWRYTDDGDLTGLRQVRSDNKGMALFLSASSGRGGTVAEQILNLPAGEYRLSLTAGNVPRGTDVERPRVTLRCEGTGKQLLAEIILPVLSDGGASVAARFAVPEGGCPAQWIRIDARMPLSGADDTMPWIDKINIQPVND